MNNDKLKVFKSEADVRSYAKVNGYDKGGIDKLVTRWETLENEPKEPLIINKVVSKDSESDPNNGY